MAAGIKIFNANGTLQLDTSNRTFRLLTVAIVNGSGSINVIGYSGNIQASVVTAGSQPPTTTVNQDTGEVSWTYPPGDNQRGIVRVLEF